MFFRAAIIPRFFDGCEPVDYIELISVRKSPTIVTDTEIFGLNINPELPLTSILQYP